MALSFFQKLLSSGTTSLLPVDGIPVVLSSSTFPSSFHIDTILPEIVKLAGKRKSQYLKLQSRMDEDA